MLDLLWLKGIKGVPAEHLLCVTCRCSLPEAIFSSFKAPGGGGVTFITSFMVEPTTIIFTPFVTFNSLNVLLPSLTSPAGYTYICQFFQSFSILWQSTNIIHWCLMKKKCDYYKNHSFIFSSCWWYCLLYHDYNLHIIKIIIISMGCKESQFYSLPLSYHELAQESMRMIRIDYTSSIWFWFFIFDFPPNRIHQPDSKIH